MLRRNLRTLVSFVSLATSLSLLACSSATVSDAGPTPDAGDAGPAIPRVVLGTGTSNFEELAEGAEMELVAGSQGGFHIWLTARFYNLNMRGLRLTFEAVDVATGEVVEQPFIFILSEARVVREGDHYVRAGDFLVLDTEPPPDVVGLTLRVTARAEEAEGGAMVEDSRVVTIVDRE